MTSPKAIPTQQRAMYHNIVSENNGRLELHMENLLHVVDSVDNFQVKDNFPVATLSVFGSKEIDKQSITQNIIKKLSADVDEKQPRNVSTENDKSPITENILNTPYQDDQLEANGIFIWSQPFIMKMGVHACMKPLIILILYVHFTQASRKPLENFLLKFCSKIVNVDGCTSEVIILSI